jgi:hypothetical protein
VRPPSDRLSATGASPFRATVVERYARARDRAVSARHPTGALLVVLWLLLCLALAVGATWLMLAWRYFAA